MNHRERDILAALINQAACDLPEDNFALRAARKLLAEAAEPDANTLLKGHMHHPEPEVAPPSIAPWVILPDSLGHGGFYAFNSDTGERTPQRAHYDSAFADAKEALDRSKQNALLNLLRACNPRNGFWVGNSRYVSHHAGVTPKQIRRAYEAKLREMSRERLDYLLRAVPAPTHAATLDALRGAAVRYFRWGQIGIADIDEAINF